MSDAPPPLRPDQTPGRHPAGPLTAAGVDAVLADFRGWLEQLGDGEAAPERPAEAVDLFTLIGQFTALRHEVNLQTKAARAATEQTADALKLLAHPRPAADPDDAVRPLVKSLVDVADALATSLRHVERVRTAAEDALAAPPPAEVPQPSWLARQLGATIPPFREPAGATLAAKLRPLVAGVADGYALSLRRVERALAGAGAEAIECVGRPFHPELMEVVEAVDAADRVSGTVVDEVRRGYRWKGSVFRFAQVRVAR